MDSPPTPASVPPVASDSILLETRIVSVILVPILTLAFLILYFESDNTGQHFAWTIRPPMTPMIMGAGYVAGAYYFARMAIARRWHHLGRSLPAVSVFAFVMAVVTVLHWDRFNHSHLAFQLWVILYAVAPPLVFWLWVRNRRQDTGRPDVEDREVPWFVRLGLGIVGLAALALSAVLLFAPTAAIDFWPWTLSPLTARVLSGWFALAGTASVLLGRDGRWSAWRISFQSTFLWAILVAIGIIREWSNFDSHRMGTWIFVVAVTAWVVGFATLYIRMERMPAVRTLDNSQS